MTNRNPIFSSLKRRSSRADQGLSNSLPVMVRIDAQPIDLRADRAVPFQQQQTDRLAADPRNPSFQDLRLRGVVPVGLGLGEPFRQAWRKSFQNAAADAGSFSSAIETSMLAIQYRHADAAAPSKGTPRPLSHSRPLR